MPRKRPARSRTSRASAKISPRPLGVSIICILGYIMSVIGIVVGIVSIAFASLLATAVNAATGIAGTEGVFVAVGAAMVISSLIGLVAFFFLWKMRRSGLLLTTLVGVFSIVMGIISLSVVSFIGVIVWIIFLAYLWKKKSLFK